MQFLEVFLIAAGTLLLVVAYWLGRRQGTGGEPPAPRKIGSGLSTEKAIKLQKSLTELLHELHTLSRDVAVDLEQKLSELKELLQLADTKFRGLSSAKGQERHLDIPPPERQPGEEVPMESPDSKPLVTLENDDASQPPPGRYQQIYQMADEGFPLDEIARHLQMGKGEIQLILSLRKKD